MTALVALIIAGACIYLAERFRPFVHRHFVLLESRAASTGELSVPPIPADILASINKRDEEWAQADARALICQQYLDARPYCKTDGEAWAQVRVQQGNALRLA